MALHECGQALLVATQQVAPDSRNLAGAYVQAVSHVERLLRSNFVDASLAQLRTPRFWAINSFDGLRMIEMVNDERDAQMARLEYEATQIKSMRDRFSGSTSIAVVDTHVLLHYRLFDEVPWLDIVVDVEDLLLVVPLRVVDELDAKKSAARREDLRDRARTVIRALERCLDRRGIVRSDVRLEGVGLADLDPESYRNPPLPVDIEILDVCEGVASYAAGKTNLVTGDLGMRIRARERSIGVIGMPDAHLLRQDRRPAGGG